MAEFEMRDLRVESPKTTADFRSLVFNAPMPWEYDAGGNVRDANGTQVCVTSAHLAIIIVLAVNTCAGHRMTETS